MELAESLRPTLIHALRSLRDLYDDEDVWRTAEQAVAAVDVPPSRLIESVANYPDSLPALLVFFGYRPPESATQLVSNAVVSLQQVPEDEDPTVAVSKTRDALGELLERALDLEAASPWLLPDIASETIPALDMGVTLATGAATSGVMAIVGAAVVPATLIGGGLALAPVLILGGCYYWRRKRNLRKQNEQLLELHERLPLDLVPAARAAVIQHLDTVLNLQKHTNDKNPQAILDLRNNLEALTDIARRFGSSDSRLRTAANQHQLKTGDASATKFLGQLPQLLVTAAKAKAGLDTGLQIDPTTLAQLEKERYVIANLN
ncbi:hypothetical protein OHA18_40420 [Kribbella sp. NBC_00709]|uniref:hypothetical protein n=1 Tax=Kribbella sp. NBC_00709 TaxID=2975972 RepID=UPI002E29AA38|nr:hypothetical protein [Kribbella sp. NBC_00709]